jgi:hypothetical protein
MTVPSLPGEVCAEPRSGLRVCGPTGTQVVRLTVTPVVCVEVVAISGRDRAPQRGWARVGGPGSYVRGVALPGVLDDVPAGAELDVEADVPGFGSLRERLPAVSRVELSLPAPAELSVEVEGPSAAFPARLSLAGPERRELGVEAPGHVTLEGLAPGQYILMVDGTTSGAQSLEFVLGPGERRVLAPVRLAHGGALEVRGRGWVSLRVDATGALASVADLGGGGVRQFTGLPEGWLTVMTRADRGWSRVSRVWVTQGSATIVDLERAPTP